VALSRTISFCREEKQRPQWQTNPSIGIVETPDYGGSTDPESITSVPVQRPRIDRFHSDDEKKRQSGGTKRRKKSLGKPNIGELGSGCITRRRRQSSRANGNQNIHFRSSDDDTESRTGLLRWSTLPYPYGRKPSWPPRYYTIAGRPSHPSWKVIDSQITELILGSAVRRNARRAGKQKEMRSARYTCLASGKKC